MATDAAELVGLIESQLETAQGCATGELADMRRKALDRYYGKARGDEKPGRSSAQSSDVADMVEALTAQLVPSFAGDSVVTFEPLGEGDTDQAWLESGVVNGWILEENGGYLLLQEALRDALLLRNGWVKAWRDVKRQVNVLELSGIDVDAVPGLLGQAGPGETRELVELVEREGGLLDARIKVIQERERMRVAAVDPINMRWAEGYDSLNIQEIPFLAETFFPSRTWLIERGHSKAKVYALPAADEPTGADSRARSRGDSGFAPRVDRSMERVECAWIYIRYDQDGDGAAELHQVLFAAGGRTPEDRILADEIVGFIPYATGTPWLQPHRLDGLGVYDKLAQVEGVKTAALRQWIDNLAHCNSSRLGVNVRTVQVQDVLDNRPGGLVRVNGEPGAQLMPITAPDIGGSALALLQYQDSMRSERGGASLDLQTASAQIAGETAHGVERQYAAREQMAAMICRSLAETLVRQLYLIVHQGAREWLTQPVPAKMQGRFTLTDPKSWPERERVNVATGLSVGERQRKRQALEVVIQQQEKLAQAGMAGILVTAEGYYAALMDWSRAAEIDNAERYFADPRSPGSQQAAQQQQQQQQAAQQIQTQLATLAAAAAQQQQVIENRMRKYESDQKTALEYFKQVMQAELELLKAGEQQATRELQVLGLVRSGEEYQEADAGGEQAMAGAG